MILTLTETLNGILADQHEMTTLLIHHPPTVSNNTKCYDTPSGSLGGKKQNTKTRDP